MVTETYPRIKHDLSKIAMKTKPMMGIPKTHD